MRELTGVWIGVCAAVVLSACSPDSIPATTGAPGTGTGSGAAGTGAAGTGAAGTGAAGTGAAATASPEALGYRSEEVTFGSGTGADAVTLAGTLLVPVGPKAPAGKLGAVVLVAGSGPTDRDWNNPLIPGKVDTGRILAEQLAAAGMATLRYDKRGTGASTKVTVAKWGDFDADLLAARAFLAARPEIDPARIGVLGHSEGAMLAAKAVAAAPPGTFAALAHLSGPGRTFAAILKQQVHDSLARDGVAEPAMAATLAYLDDALAKIGRGEVPGTPGGAVAPMVTGLVGSLTATPNVDFVRGWLAHDPVATLAKVGCPVLLGVGANDAQVGESDLSPLAKALAAAGRTDVTVKTFKETDHVLKVQPKLPTAMTSQEIALSYGETRLVSLEVVDALRDFFGKTLAAK